MSLRSIDLNLVPVLQKLLRERSVSATARQLGLTQPAVSAALRRIRLQLGDDLLVRINGKMELTPRAEVLVGPVDAVCNDLEQLFVPARFDPLHATNVFIVASPDQGAFLLAPEWLARLAVHAPNCQLRFVDFDEQVHARLAAREIDLVVMPRFLLEDIGPTPMHFRTLFTDHPAALFREEHPLAALDTLSVSDLTDWRLLSVHPGAAWIERKRTMALLGTDRLISVASVPQVTLLPFLLMGTDQVAIVSQQMAERLVGSLPLGWRPLSWNTGAIETGVGWSHLMHADPAHRWFRETIVGLD